ncbi:hypothetical protein [Dyella acidiphila]|nr:hypothetical protein [Dyella acidiphila]
MITVSNVIEGIIGMPAGTANRSILNLRGFGEAAGHRQSDPATV